MGIKTSVRSWYQKFPFIDFFSPVILILRVKHAKNEPMIEKGRNTE